MYEWNDAERAIQSAVRDLVDREVRPQIDDPEQGDLAAAAVSPSDVLRTFHASFWLDVLARDSVQEALR